jgi:hypothetical protein
MWGFPPSTAGNARPGSPGSFQDHSRISSGSVDSGPAAVDFFKIDFKTILKRT